jgi:hypothetical protein
MYVFMRTTLILDDLLFREAKQKAAASGTTLSDLMNSALRRFLYPPLKGSTDRPERFHMPVFGEAAKLHLSPAELAEFRDDGR